jgi:hypothetical protein
MSSPLPSSVPSSMSSPLPSPMPSPVPLPVLSLPDLVTSPPGMPLLPEATYSSAKEAEGAIMGWAVRYNYAFMKLRSKSINTGRRKQVWGCDRSGQPPPSNSQLNTNQARQRHTSSRKTGCKFSINLVEVNPTCWEIRHREAQFCAHNHSPSLSLWSHPIHRQLGKEEMDKLRELHSAGISSL